MAIRKTIVNFDHLFNSLKSKPVIINKIDNFSEEDRTRNNGMIFTEYKGDVYNTSPTCDCENEALAKEYFVGVTCPICQTKVQNKLDRVLESKLWMEAPEGVADFINPEAWYLLKSYLGVDKGNFDVLLWLTTTDTHFPKYKALQEEILETGIERGYNNFVTNFKKYLALINTVSVYRKHDRRAQWEEVFKIFNEFGKNIFSFHFPVINRNLLVMESEAKGRYIDKAVPQAVDAVRLILGIDNHKTHMRLAARENRTAKMISGMVAFYYEYFKTNYASKTGLIRKHMGSSRAGYTMRGVITSVTKPHRHDELEFPWGPSIGLMRTYLQNRLTRLGMRPNDVFGFLATLVHNYHPLVDKIFNDLINECPYPGLPGTFCRNPSLHRSSLQRMFGAIIKTDPNDPTIGLPITSVVGFNADFK